MINTMNSESFFLQHLYGDLKMFGMLFQLSKAAWKDAEQTEECDFASHKRAVQLRPAKL